MVDRSKSRETQKETEAERKGVRTQRAGEQAVSLPHLNTTLQEGGKLGRGVTKSSSAKNIHTIDVWGEKSI